MPRLTVELKLKVIRLIRGFRVCDILKNLKKENGVSIGRRQCVMSPNFFVRMKEPESFAIAIAEKI